MCGRGLLQPSHSSFEIIKSFDKGFFFRGGGGIMYCLKILLLSLSLPENHGLSPTMS